MLWLLALFAAGHAAAQLPTPVYAPPETTGSALPAPRPPANPVDKIIEFSRQEEQQKRNTVVLPENKPVTARPLPVVSKKPAPKTTLRVTSARSSLPIPQSDATSSEPPEIVHHVSPSLPAVQFFEMAGKLVRANIRIGPNGEVVQVKVLDAMDLGASHAVLTALKQWQFKPTGQNQTMDLQLRFDLNQ
jgi:hypothetical protein